MAGIDNITNEILKDAEARALAITSDAKKRAEAHLAEARSEGEALAAKAREKAEASAKAYAGRIISQAEMRKRQALLGAKQEFISEVLDAAKTKLASRDADAYFAMLLKLIGTHLEKGSGELLLSERDLKRLPEGFEKKAAELAEKAGGSLALSKKAADIEDGFVLRYGGVEENCTLKALFAEKRDVLTDVAAGVLWHKENADG